MIASTLQFETLRNDFLDGLDRAQPKLLRTLSQFALDEIILPPTGPHKNEPFQIEFQPFTRLWFELFESGRFPRYAVTGGVQQGKTFNILVITAMYYLFEVGENVVYGIPSMSMSYDKWVRDLLPVIKASRYADQLPETGVGSKGGTKFESITFRNGMTLKFMSAAGGDEKRSGFTSRILLMTEVDKYDQSAEASRESDPVTQMIARLGAYDDLKVIVLMECTVSIKDGRIWTEIKNGSDGRIACPCPHCSEYVTLEREHLVGWQDATNEIDARASGYFACPACGSAWTEAERYTANLHAKLVHKGQTITPDGVIHGPLPKTMTAGFRWNAANNALKPAADIAGKEWNARYAPDETNSDKALRQFDWAMPAADVQTDLTPLNVATLLERTHPLGRGVVPPDCDSIAVGIDLGGWWCHWTAIAYGANARGYIIDYGRISVPQATLGLEAGLMEAMREFRAMCGRGWIRTDGAVILPEENLLDSGWQTPLVYQFIQETGLPYRAAKGLSVSGEPVSYTRPKQTGAVVLWIGDGWHLARLKDDNILLLEIDPNAAKSLLHARLNCEITAPGAITMFQIDRTLLADVEERRKFVRHLTAEKTVTQFKPGKGTITTWEKIRQDNHHLDSSCLALVGGSIAGVNVIEAAGEHPPTSVHEAPRPAVVPAPVVQVVRNAAPTISQETNRVPGPVRDVSSGWIRRRR